MPTPDSSILPILQEMFRSYSGKNRNITPENVFQPAIEEGREVFETFVTKYLLPGSKIDGQEHLEEAFSSWKAGKKIIFLAEHRGNFDVPSLAILLRQAHPKYEALSNRLMYIAGRKLNESSDIVKVFAEKYSRLIIVPRREYPKAPKNPQEEAAYEGFVSQANRINRAAFRQMMKLRQEGWIVVLYPLGGRIKEGFSQQPIPEAASYVRAFDKCYFISMEGNILEPKANMEEETPVATQVVFRFGPGLDCKEFLDSQQKLFEASKDNLSQELTLPQFTVDQVMWYLEELRSKGGFDLQKLAQRDLQFGR